MYILTIYGRETDGAYSVKNEHQEDILFWTLDAIGGSQILGPSQFSTSDIAIHDPTDPVQIQQG